MRETNLFLMFEGARQHVVRDTMTDVPDCVPTRLYFTPCPGECCGKGSFPCCLFIPLKKWRIFRMEFSHSKSFCFCFFFGLQPGARTYTCTLHKMLDDPLRVADEKKKPPGMVLAAMRGCLDDAVKRAARNRAPSKVAFAPVFVWLLIYSTQPRVVKSVDQHTLPMLDSMLLPGVTRTLACRQVVALDVLAALVYSAHFLIPFVPPVVLYFVRGTEAVDRFAWCFGLVNVIAVVLQLVWPTAPPWYEGDGKERVEGSAAGLARVDALLGMQLFETLYSRAKIVFGAFPSLHAAWPLLLAMMIGGRVGVVWGVLHTAWVSWAAVYLRHHYFIDAVGGWAIVVLVVCHLPCPRCCTLKTPHWPRKPRDLEAGISEQDDLYPDADLPPKTL